MEIFFVLGVRYPTEKAYGVTTGRTCQALNEINVQSSILAPTTLLEDDFGNRVIDITQNLKHSFPPKNSKKTLVFMQKFMDGWNVGRRLRTLNKSSHSYFIFRDLALAMSASTLLPKRSISLEIHHHNSRVKKIIIAYLVKWRQLKIITITKNSFEEWESQVKRTRVALIPMGVHRDFYQKSLPLKSTEAVRVCYVGSATSSGHDNNLLQMINSLGNVSSNQLRIDLTLVGVPRDFLSSEALPKNTNLRIDFIEYVRHKDVPQILAKQSIGLIPYQESLYHNYRFPIKVVEYAASGLSIVASDTFAHRSILNCKIAHFVDFSKPESVRKVLLEIRKHYYDEGKRRSLARKWAIQYSYENRANTIKNFVDSI